MPTQTTTSSGPIIASPHVLSLLDRLHSLSSAEESSISTKLFYLSLYFRFYVLRQAALPPSAYDHMRTKFVALEPEKCQFLYLLARSLGVRNAVEAGTSFGVSTIYLALAVGQNGGGKVIATEIEVEKARRARGYWEEAGEEVEKYIELREGDLLETLKEGVDEVELLLLDIWTPMALPTLKILQPKMKKGAVVVADNTIASRGMYRGFLEYVGDPANGFRTTTMPFAGGLEMSVYLPDE